MENFVQRFSYNIQKFVKFLQLKVQRRQPASKYILFDDFFVYEKLSRALGYTFLVNSGTAPNKWSRFHGILVQLTEIMMMVLLIISIKLSRQEGELMELLKMS